MVENIPLHERPPFYVEVLDTTENAPDGALDVCRVAAQLADDGPAG
jgi:hypothetical protein